MRYSIKLIEKLSRRHLIHSSDVFVIKGFTVLYFVRKYILILLQASVESAEGDWKRKLETVER